MKQRLRDSQMCPSMPAISGVSEDWFTPQKEQ